MTLFTKIQYISHRSISYVYHCSYGTRDTYKWTSSTFIHFCSGDKGAGKGAGKGVSVINKS